MGQHPHCEKHSAWTTLWLAAKQVVHARTVLDADGC